MLKIPWQSYDKIWSCITVTTGHATTFMFCISEWFLETHKWYYIVFTLTYIQRSFTDIVSILYHKMEILLKNIELLFLQILQFKNDSWYTFNKKSFASSNKLHRKFVTQEYLSKSITCPPFTQIYLNSGYMLSLHYARSIQEKNQGRGV